MKILWWFMTTVLLGLGVFTMAQHEGHSMGNKRGMDDMVGMEMGSHNMLAGLGGKELELAFLSGMIEHHRGAIEMAQ
jgi:uncharacterized protein (DUF305 family)